MIYARALWIDSAEFQVMFKQDKNREGVGKVNVLYAFQTKRVLPEWQINSIYISICSSEMPRWP